MSVFTTKRLFQFVKNYLWHLPKSLFFNIYYGWPSKKLTLIGVTGTDGKTTTCHLLHQTLINSGIKAEVISTINSPGLHTTSPDPQTVQKLLKKYYQAGVTHLVIEVTAHALDQFRFFGCNFLIGVLTNTSHEHQDDFLDMDSYIQIKSKLLKHAKTAITNKDDPSFPILSKLINKRLITYGINHRSTYQAKNIQLSPKQLKFQINKLNFITDSNYEYQVYNILACYAVIKALSLNIHTLIKTIAQFPDVKGRRQEVENDFGFRTIIDFAHTPKALKDTLASLKKITKGRIIAIFGATGGRDKTKRPIMGKVVSNLANIAIITADDTRNENVKDINAQIIQGIDKNKSIQITIDKDDIAKNITKDNSDTFYYLDIPNRQDAFNVAVKIAQSNDLIIAFGKGHETTILHGSTEYPWSELQAFKAAFNLKNISDVNTI